MMRILIIDSQPDDRYTLRAVLESMGHEVDEVASPPAALAQLERQACDVILVNLRLFSESGVDLLQQLRVMQPRVEVVVTTADPGIEKAVELIRQGAFDYLTNPFGPAQIQVVMERLARFQQLRDRIANLEERMSDEVSEGLINVGGRVTLEQLEAAHIRKVMSQCTSLEEAARVLGIDPSTLYRKRKRHRL